MNWASSVRSSARRRLLRRYWDVRSTWWPHHDARASQRRRLVERLDLLAPHEPGRPALDVGCGAGLYAIGLARLGYSATGIDFSAAMVRQAAEAARRAGASSARFAVGDLNAPLPYPDEAFVVVTSVMAMRYADDLRRTLAEVHRVLVPSGRALIVSWTPRPPDVAAGRRGLGAWVRRRLQSARRSATIRPRSLSEWRQTALSCGFDIGTDRSSATTIELVLIKARDGAAQ